MTDEASLLSVPPVVGPAWLRAHLAEVRLADVRWYLDGRSGHDAYLSGHLPGAVWVDVDTVLSGPPSAAAGRHPLPSPADFAGDLGELGIGDDDTVVAYDDQGGGMAARLVWMLRRTGQSAALLDGGLTAWAGPLDTGPVTLPPVGRRARPWPHPLIRDSAAVLAAAGTAGTVLLDARNAGRYTGAESLPSDARAGHIPGAVSAPWAANLDQQGGFRGPSDLRALYEGLGVTESTDVVVYCGSGVTACHDLLAMEHAGLALGALYPGSWSAWAADPDLPVETGGRAQM